MTITTQNDIENEVTLARTRLESALRTQEELERKETELAKTRLTLAAAKGDTTALQSQLKAAMALSIQNKLEQQDNEARIAQAQAETKLAADKAARIAKITKAKEIETKITAIVEAAAAADAALAVYQNSMASILQLQRDVSRSISSDIITESWQTPPNASIEQPTRAGYTFVEGIYRRHTDVGSIESTSIIRSSIGNFTRLAREFIVGYK
jgi:hypothetical protein